MAAADWYVENGHRAFPFVDAVAGMALPETAVVDFGCVFGLAANYDDSDDSVYLFRVARTASAVRFEFRTTAPSMGGEALVFEVPSDSLEHTYFSTSSDARIGSSSSLPSSECGDDPAWEGYLVVGDLTDLLDVLGVDDSMEDALGTTRVEPALIQNLARSFVRAVHLANADRVRVTAPDGCPAIDTGLGPGVLVTGVGCVRGDLRFSEGYNATVRQNGAAATLVFGAAVGAGAGEPCTEVPLRPGESSPDGGSLLTGGPTCAEVLKSINGVGGRTLSIRAGTGVRVFPGDVEGQLVVAIDLSGLAVCRTSSITV